MHRLTKEQAIILTGFTGILMVDDFSIFHEDVENRLNRAILTHELPSLSDEIKQVYADDFQRLVYFSDDKIEAILDKPIRELWLSGSKTNKLKGNGVKTIGDLVKLSEADLRFMKDIGDATIQEIKHMLKIHNLELGMKK